tara:strand:+ start:3779 stop:4258 length:480 start_codon:yes stop_codon:yes gene_type:complete
LIFWGAAIKVRNRIEAAHESSSANSTKNAPKNNHTMSRDKSPEERWKEPLFSQTMLAACWRRVGATSIVLLGLLACAAPPGIFFGLLWLACALACQGGWPWIVLLGGPFLMMALFVVSMVSLYELTDRVEGNSQRYLKIYLGVLFVLAPMVAIKLVLFR